MTKKFTKQEKKARKKEYEQERKAIVFTVYAENTIVLEFFIDTAFNEYSKPDGSKMSPEAKGYKISRQGKLYDKVKDSLARIVEPNKIWTIGCAQELGAKLIKYNFHFDYDETYISRKDLLERKDLPSII